jgi:hypothetical protein
MEELAILRELNIPITSIVKEKHNVEQSLKSQVANGIILNYSVKFDSQWINRVVFYEKISHYISKRYRQKFLKRYKELLNQNFLIVTTQPLRRVKNIKINFVIDHKHSDKLYNKIYGTNYSSNCQDNHSTNS